MRVVARSAWPLGVAAAAFAVAVGLPSSDPDMWWHLASGRWMVEHREALRIDIFSSTATGEAYVLGEQLGDVALYAAYALASWPGLLVLRATLVALAAFATTRSALRSAPARVAVPLAALALVLSKPLWTDRPQLFTLALVPLTLELLLAARGGSRAALVATVPLVFAWSALHGGYAVGIALLWLFALDALLERRDAAPMIVAAVAATIAVSADPVALSLARSVSHVAGKTPGIVEESPVDVLTPFGALFALVVGLALVSFLRGGGSLLAALVLVPLLGLALSAQRHVPLFGFAAVPFLASGWEAMTAGGGDDASPWAGLRDLLPAAMSRTVARSARFLGGVLAAARSRMGERSRASSRRQPARQVQAPHGEGRRQARASARDANPPRQRRRRQREGLLPLAMWAAAIGSVATIPTVPDTTTYPTAALATLKSTTGILLNEYDWGGYLIWNAPERPVFVDGRLFPFTVTGVIDQYRRALAVLPGYRATLERWNVAQVLIRPARPLAQALRDDGWTVRSEGSGYVLLERPR